MPLGFNVMDYGASNTGTNVAATTTAIAQAITDAEVAGYTTHNGAEVFFPPGFYKTNSVLSWTKAIKLRGASRYGTILQNDTTDLFNPNGNGWSVESMRLNGVGGHIFASAGAGNALAGLHDLRMEMFNANKSIWYQDGGQLYIDMNVDHCEMQLDPAAAQPGWYMIGNAGALNSNTWSRLRINGQHRPVHFFHIEETATSQYTYDNVFQDITGELCDGGMIKGMSPHSWYLRNVENYDTTTYTGDVFYFSKTTAANPKALQMVNCGRRAGTLGSGVKDLTITGTGKGHVLTNVGPQNGAAVLSIPNAGVSLFQPSGPSFTDALVLAPFDGNPAVTIGNGYALGPGLLLKPASGSGTYTSEILQVQTDAGVQRMSIGAGGWLDMTQQTAPAAPSAATARLFVRDNGAGKTQVCVRFPTGAVQVIATEP